MGPHAHSRDTGSQLALALLGYFGLVTLVITLSPFDFVPGRWRAIFVIVPRDVIANVALFVPLGFLLRAAAPRARCAGWWVIPAAACFSIAIEAAQIFVRSRYASPIDVATNTLGACLGVLLRNGAERWALWNGDTVHRLRLDVPLAGLLYLLVPQLWLSSVGVARDPWRSATTVLLGSTGIILMAALFRHHTPSGAAAAVRYFLPIALLWFVVGAWPAISIVPASLGIVLLMLLVAMWLMAYGGSSHLERRVEAETLRRVLPLFVLYLLVAAWWPPLRPFTAWHGALGFSNGMNGAAIRDVLHLLEQVGGFTVIGYAIAEWRGRRELALRADLPRVLCAALMLALLLEAGQGVLAGPGASLVRLLLLLIGAVYGATVYHLARAHIRALRLEGTEFGAINETRAA